MSYKTAIIILILGLISFGYYFNKGNHVTHINSIVLKIHSRNSSLIKEDKDLRALLTPKGIDYLRKHDPIFINIDDNNGLYDEVINALNSSSQHLHRPDGFLTYEITTDSGIFILNASPFPFNPNAVLPSQFYYDGTRYGVIIPKLTLSTKEIIENLKNK